MSIKKAAISALLFVFLLMFAAESRMFAQSGGATLQGTVTDSSGAVLPGATVVITSEQTDVARSIVSNSAGIFSAPDLAPGRYKMAVSANGFTTAELRGIVLTVGGVRDQPVSLAVGEISSQVTVTTATPALDSVSSTVQGVVDGRTTRDLPLNGRDFTNLASLQPGVTAIQTQYTSNATSTTRLSRGLGSQLSIGGNRPQQNSYRLDGVNTNDYANGSSGSVSGYILGVDAVQEFSVIISNAPAPYGRMSGGVINSVTRSGTNDYHGSIYDYLRNSVFDSRKFLDPARIPSFRRNQFGATAGGHIIKDRTFFFGNYEGLRQSLGSSLTAVVPSLDARNGLLCVPGKTQPVDPCASKAQTVIDPKVKPYLALYNLPNLPGSLKKDTGTYAFVTQQATNEDFSTVHLDHNLTGKDLLRGTMLYDTASTTSADASNAVQDEAISRRTTASLEEIHNFSGNFTNAFRLGFNRAVAIAPLQRGVINPAASDTSLGFFPNKTIGSLLVSGLQTFNGGVGAVGTNGYHYNSYQLYDDASLSLGKHSMTFGFAAERVQSNAIAGLLPNGSWNFGSIAKFLTNAPSYFESGLPSTPVSPTDLRTTILAGYVQDDWRILNNLTLNLGLRYEMNTNVSAVGPRVSKLLSPTDPAAQIVPSYFTKNPTVRNFEPRVGFAWDPYGQGKTVFRGAVGLYDVLPLPYFLMLQQVSSAPIYDEGRNTAVAKGSFPRDGFLNVTPKLRAIYTPPEPGRSYIIQYTANMQQQITPSLVMTLGYIGSHGIRQPYNTNDINIVSPFKTAQGYIFPQKGTVQPLNPVLGTISGTYFVGSSLYNSLQSTLRYQATRGITGLISYTWSRSIDDSSSSLSGASFGNSLASTPSFDQRLNRALSDFDTRHVFTASSVATLPSPRATYLAPLRGWTLNNIFLIRGGVPFTPIIGGDPLATGSSAPFAFPDKVRSGSCVRPNNIAYIDTSCFAFPDAVSYGAGLKGQRLGNSGRNSLIGPGIFSWTTGLQKETKVTERVRVQLQAQAFNVTNRTNYGNPTGPALQIFSATPVAAPLRQSQTPALATAGRLTSSGDARQLQFSLKILY